MMLLLQVFLVIFFIVQGVAFITLYERHLLGGSQQRIGPNKSSFAGVLQAIFDGIKLLKKEQLTPFRSVNLFFLLVPSIAFAVMFMEWFVFPFFWNFFTFEYSVVFLLCLIGFMVYSILISGLVSKSKYGVVGALRASSQSVSYEIAFSLYILSIVSHFSMFYFNSNFGVGLMLIYIPFLLMTLSELNRAPFDFSEGESELVSGFNVEFGSIPFILLFLSEYGSLIFFSLLFSVLFFNFSMLAGFVLFSVLVFIRSSYPRFRYDMMMNFFWFKMLPLSLIFLFYFVVLMFF
uniref:NADH-ubiquinone oxidoreductase chain 1 n=1 Tax=Rhigonema thysanophora TaxID=435730 RepID=X2CTB7_9BILA|nr:NADH dehydrogenase subunit 1 [Rhigonema thysanophora]AGZ90410.1 NADH dehydrogenase subunit 1 [Rhigonema thysanophora]